MSVPIPSCPTCPGSWRSGPIAKKSQTESGRRSTPCAGDGGPRAAATRTGRHRRDDPGGLKPQPAAAPLRRPAHERRARRTARLLATRVEPRTGTGALRLAGEHARPTRRAHDHLAVAECRRSSALAGHAARLSRRCGRRARVKTGSTTAALAGAAPAAPAAAGRLQTERPRGEAPQPAQAARALAGAVRRPPAARAGRRSRAAGSG